MTLVDWAVVIIMMAACLQDGPGLFSFRLLAGRPGAGPGVAAWNYGRLAAIFLPLVRIPAVANTIAFLLIALVVMAADWH